MKKILILLSVIAFTFSCSDEVTADHECSTPATIVDLSLDGCGFVFELEDGSYLIPLRVFWCGTPPVSDAQKLDPLYNFELVDGKKVWIDYTEETAATACMAGKTVRISCISERRSLHEE